MRILPGATHRQRLAANFDAARALVPCNILSAKADHFPIVDRVSLFGNNDGQGTAFEGRALAKDRFGTTKVYISRGDVFERLVIAPVIVVVDKLVNGLLKLPGEVMLLQADDILQRAMVALDFALRHGMEGFATNVD